MQMTGRSLTWGLLSSLAAIAIAGDRAAAAPPAPPPAQGTRTHAPHPVPSEDTGAQLPELPVAPGSWSENKLYRFRIERVEPCGQGPAVNIKGESSWVGAYFTVEAKQPDVFVTARDLELRRGGVILSATLTNPPSLPSCKPLLSAKRMRPGETISGFALFEVPKSFRVPTKDPIVFSYRPTRWGGARRAEVPIPECFDACARSWVSSDGKTAAPIPAAARRKL